MQGIKVKPPEIVIDHFSLGTAFAHWNSEQQARFLAGASIELDSMDGIASGMQLQFIAEEYERDQPSLLSESKSRVVSVLRRLLESLEG